MENFFREVWRLEIDLKHLNFFEQLALGDQGKPNLQILL